MNSVYPRIKEDAVGVQAVVRAAISPGVSRGLNLTSDQVGSLLAVRATVLGFITRTRLYTSRNLKTTDGQFRRWPVREDWRSAGPWPKPG
jgi:hypothetical protein